MEAGHACQIRGCRTERCKIALPRRHAAEMGRGPRYGQKNRYTKITQGGAEYPKISFGVPVFCPEGGDLGSDLNCSQLPGSSFLGQSSILALLPGVLRSRSLSPSRAVHRDKLFLAPVGKAPPQIPPLSFLTELTLPSPRHRTLNDPTRISPPILILGRSLPSS